MAVPELIKFREKYPDYGDMDDATLAGKLAAKYPDAYGDLPGKVGPVNTGGGVDPFTVSPAATEAMRRKFVSETGTLGQRAKEYIPSRKTVAAYARPVLEGGGAVAGGILGSGAAPVAGTLLGAGLGYAAGARAADIIEGKTAPKGAVNMLAQNVGDVATGAMMEMGGQVAGKAITGGVNALRSARTKGLPFSDKRNAFRAAEQFADAQAPGTPVAAEANLLRQKETTELTNRLKPTVTPTPGQGSGNYKSAALEQSMSAKDPAFAERLKYRDAELNKAAVNNLTTTLGKPADLPAVQPASMTGEAQVKAVKSAMKPVLSKEAEMWADVPAYPMPADSTEAAFKTALATPSTAKSTIKSVYDIFKQTPRTVEGLQTIEREINSAMKAGTDTDRHFLRSVKQAVQDDFEAMGEAAVKGDVALVGDKIVYPSKLRADLARVEEQIAAAQTAAPSLKESNTHLMKYLAGKGETVMQNTGVTDAQYAKSLADRLSYLQKQGKAADYVPPVGTGQPTNPLVTNLESQRAVLTDKLANLQPADDVAAKYAAAKRYSREEKFERFYRGAVQDVLESGEQASGLRIPAEQVPAKFFTPTGSKDLIRAVGKQQAAEQSMPHAVEQLVSKTVDANTGVMNVPRAIAWMRQNANTLDNLGLTPAVERVIKGQIPRAIEAELELKAVDVLGNPAATTLQAAKMIKKFGPSVEKMYGAKGMQALHDWGQMMEVIGRNKYVSYAKGSTTVEKSAATADMAEKVSTLAAVATGHGWVFSATKNIAKSLMGPALNYSKAQVNRILQEALINPEAAAVLMKIAKATPQQVSAESHRWLKPIIVQMQVSGKLATQPAPQQPDAPSEEVTE